MAKHKDWPFFLSFFLRTKRGYREREGRRVNANAYLTIVQTGKAGSYGKAKAKNVPWIGNIKQITDAGNSSSKA